MAKIYNVHDAKSNLSKLIEEVLAGESVTIARAGLPLVDLTIHSPRKVQLGFMSQMVDHVLTDEEEAAAFAPLDHSAWAIEDATKW
jgi:antitoxin (DNA-binding transcriptional repressor) of toxin-antitoxin stability system